MRRSCLRFLLNKLSLMLSLGDEGSRGAAAFLASAVSAIEPMNQFWSKATIFCGGWILVASAVEPMKSILVKGNYMTLEAGIWLPLPF